jgi:hypothetical protein
MQQFTEKCRDGLAFRRRCDAVGEKLALGERFRELLVRPRNL